MYTPSLDGEVVFHLFESFTIDIPIELCEYIQ